MKKKFIKLLIATGAVCLFLTTAFAGDITVGELSARLDDLEKSMKDENGDYSDYPADNSMDSQEGREALRRLTDKIDTLERKIVMLESRQGGSPAFTPVPQQYDHYDHEDKNPASSSSSEDLSQEESILKLLEEASPSDPKSKQAEQKAEKEKVREEATKKAEATAPTLAKGSADAQYNQASTLYEKREYPQAEKAFQYIIDMYPGDPITKKAHYWMAESCFAQNKLAEAKVAFIKAYQVDSKSPRAPDCLLKLGMVLAAQNKKADACTAWKKLTTDYSNKMSQETKLALADAKKKYGCK